MKVIRILSLVRLGVVGVSLAKLLLDRSDFPPGYEAAAWWLVGVEALMALGLLALAVRWRARLRWLAILNVAADFALITAWLIIDTWEPGQPFRTVLFLVVVEAALFFGLRGGSLAAAFAIPVFAAVEAWRQFEFGDPAEIDSVVLRGLVALALGGIVGRLVDMEREQARAAVERAAEAERLRDELGRRIDLREATSRAARALGSSLDLDVAFAAFVQELRGLLPFDRAAILLVEGSNAVVMATAGIADHEFLGQGSSVPVAGSILEPVINRDRTIYREDISEQLYPEEKGLLELGVRSRVLAPLHLGSRVIGALAISRTEPAAFRAEEVELVTLLGRLVATAVQNLRAHEAERATVEELRRLSSLRADFVSLVSHELRSPMAAVIGSARTLQQRWRELRPEQREAFLAVIGDETARLSTLIGDVLDTSRIEAGTFGYVFSDVDLAEIVRDSVAAAELGQDEVRLASELPTTLPRVRGDSERLRQLIDNLVSNAVKYSESGSEVRVQAEAVDGQVLVRVRDSGPGIPLDEQRQIFEKFGRATGSAKPGSGLGLFLARSFAEAHGGKVSVQSRQGEGATFTLTLPIGT
ncbi:MAG TPA: ATP-binding protein [Gaiellaceae bacterium]|nr:ATP-binding protein [Gaiellaceae bacterium]